MIEYKRISFKYVVLAFLIAACLIILLSIDRKNNEAPPVEDVFIEELFKPELERVETYSIHGLNKFLPVSYTHLTLPTKA